MNISESFNSEQLSGFAINYSGYNDNQNQSLSLTEDRDVLRYEYQIEQATNTQSLNFQIDFEHQVLDLDLSTSTNGSYDDDSVSVVLQQLSSNIESHKKNISSKVERGTSSLNIISSNESLLADSLSNMLKSTKTDQSQVTFISDKVASSDYRQGLSVANTERPSVSALSDFEMFFLVDKDNAFKFSQNTDVSDKDNGQELIQELHFKSQSSMWGTEDAERNYTFTSVITENTETTNVLIGGGGEIAQVTFNVEDFSTSYSARTVSIEGIGNRPGEDLPPEIYEEKVFSRSSSYKMNEVDTSTTEEVTHNIASYFLKELASVRGISKHEERVIQQLVIKE